MAAVPADEAAPEVSDPVALAAVQTFQDSRLPEPVQTEKESAAVSVFSASSALAGEPGPEPLEGDLNRDGAVNITDINILINIILGATMDTETMTAADVNKDGSINVSDMNRIIAIILQ